MARTARLTARFTSRGGVESKEPEAKGSGRSLRLPSLNFVSTTPSSTRPPAELPLRHYYYCRHSTPAKTLVPVVLDALVAEADGWVPRTRTVVQYRACGHKAVSVRTP